jgi:uncharacterized protein YjbI with pentapeptide repeats
MTESDRPRSPFAGMADLSARTPVRMLSLDEIERMLAEHRLYLETEYREGHRANFASADLTGRDFSGLNLRGIKMDRAVLRGANFSGAHLQRANLIGAILHEARLNHADLSGLTQDQVARAHCNGGTKLPVGLTGVKDAKR